MVPRKGRWDTHGFPCRGLKWRTSWLKRQGRRLGVRHGAVYQKSARESVWKKYKGMWRTSQAPSILGDMDDSLMWKPMMTISSSPSGGPLKEIWDKSLLYKGFKIVPYCPALWTSVLSSQEVAQGYKLSKNATPWCVSKVVARTRNFLANGRRRPDTSLLMWRFCVKMS